MTTLQRDARLDDLIGPWLPVQRWFAGGAQVTGLARAGDIPLTDAAGAPDGVEVWLHLVRATGADGRSATYQVPLTYRAAPDPALAPALLGVLADDADDADDEDGIGARWVYDGAHDPAFVRAWLAVIGAGLQARSAADAGGPEPTDGVAARLRGVRMAGVAAPAADRPGRVLSGEQSNTSIIVAGAGSGTDAADGPVIVKLFRVLQAGRNPDVVIPAALATAGCERVPGLVGWVEGEWQEADGPAWGHLAAMAEFVPGSVDGWRLALAAIEAGEPFGALAAELGAAVASVHAAMARALPTRPTSPDVLAELAAHLEDRLAWAVSAAPALAPHAAAARAVIASVRDVGTAPDCQTIHGDLHLGQALHGDSRGWVLLDFEGEPLRPLAERGAPDLALRDVAGMLRSFDYAARHATLGLPDSDPRAVAAARWSRECRDAFLDGYAAEAKHDPRDDAALLRALELDKALYETVYEVRHRPGWLEVPLRAVERLLGAS